MAEKSEISEIIKNLKISKFWKNLKSENLKNIEVFEKKLKIWEISKILRKKSQNLKISKNLEMFETKSQNQS